MVSFEPILDSNPLPEQIQYLEDRLYEFNVKATGISDGRGLAILVHDDQDELVAGLCGHTWGGCCEIRQVWVHESLRGQGLGRQLLESAEAEAKYRKCSQIILTTHSFQAPNLYRRLGYELVATLDDYPQGHSQLIFRKRSGSLGCSIPDEPLPRSNTTTEFNSRT